MHMLDESWSYGCAALNQSRRINCTGPHVGSDLAIHVLDTHVYMNRYIYRYVKRYTNLYMNRYMNLYMNLSMHTNEMRYQ